MPAPGQCPPPKKTCQKQCKDNTGFLEQALKRHAQGIFPNLKGLGREATEAEVLDADKTWRDERGKSKKAHTSKSHNKNPTNRRVALGMFSTYH
jgi:hypothetical protein